MPAAPPPRVGGNSGRSGRGTGFGPLPQGDRRNARRMKLMNRPCLAMLLGESVVAVSALTGCRTTAVAKAASDSPDQRLRVAVATAELRPMERTAEVQGALYPRERTTLAANVDGAVVQVAADFGD